MDGGGYFIGIDSIPTESPVGYELKLFGKSLLDPPRKTSYCSGSAYSAFIEGLNLIFPDGNSRLSYERYEAMRMQELDGGRREDGIKYWGHWNADGFGSQYALVQYSMMGEEIKPINARPGDFINISWEKGLGHSVIFLGWYQDENADKKVVYWSSQRGTNGFGDQVVSLDRVKYVKIVRLVRPENLFTFDITTEVKCDIPGDLVITAKNIQHRYIEYGEVIVANLPTAPFPHPKREDGHYYEDQFFPPEKHYSDNSVTIFIPKNFRKMDRVDFVLYFHGWWNNIDSVLSRFMLIEQLVESGKNAIFIVPQGPRNAPDSFGGKLEDGDGFKRFMKDIMELLRKRGKIKSKKIGNIILSGHSGGYHVISFILMRGGLTDRIQEVYLFDALYGQTEKFVYWFDHYNGRLINIYIEDGGTKNETENLIDDLKGWGIPHVAKNENELTQDDLKENRLIFIFTELEHNEVVYKTGNFQKFLKASMLLSIGKSQ